MKKPSRKSWQQCSVDEIYVRLKWIIDTHPGEELDIWIQSSEVFSNTAGYYLHELADKIGIKGYFDRDFKQWVKDKDLEFAIEESIQDGQR